MKKIFGSIFGLILLAVISGCGSKTGADLVISKYYDGALLTNNAIEIYNTTEENVNLKGYTLVIYAGDKAEITINLSGEIKTKDFFLIVHEETTNTDLLDKYDQKGALTYTGSRAVAIQYKGKIVDVIGNISNMNVQFGQNATLIRKDGHFTPKAEFDFFDYIMYGPDLHQYLKNFDYPIKTTEQLLQGPKLEDRYKEMELIDPKNGNLGGGGAKVATLGAISDGDTAAFDVFPVRIRFYYVNTPEVNSSYVTEEEFGYQASNFTKQYLTDAEKAGKEFRVQTLKGGAIKETNDRYLGLVWVDGVLLNHVIVRNGLSLVSGANPTGIDMAMTDRDIPYLTFLLHAQRYAKDNHWRLHWKPDGIRDKNWDYLNNKGKAQNWTPVDLNYGDIDKSTDYFER